MSLLQFIRLSLANFRPYWRHVCLILVALLAQTAFKVCLPLGYAQIFDGAIAHEDMTYLGVLLLLLFGAWGLNLFAGIYQDRQTAFTGAKVLNDLRLKMFLQMQRFSLSYFKKRDSGDLLSLYSNDIAAIEVAYLKSIYTVLFSSVVLIASVLLLFVIEWRLALVTLLSLPIALIGPRILGGAAQEGNKLRKQCEADVNTMLNEDIGSVAEIRAFGLQQTRIDAFRVRLEELVERIRQAFIASSLVGRTSSQTVQLVQIVIMGLGGYFAINGHLTAGTLVGFAALLMNISNASNHLASALPELFPASAGLTRIQDFLSAETDQEMIEQTDTWPEFAQIRLDRVEFKYGPDLPLALAETSLNIPTGASVAVVGGSGCGKSTILNLLLRFYSPCAGALYLDDQNLATVSEAALRAKVSVVMQNTILFQASFFENISMGLSGVTLAEVERASKMAEIHEFISGLPEGYDTLVGEWGGNLSGGQRQRIAIARAMLRNPEVLVLDEATSALDPISENAINQTLAHFTSGRTVISATHRLNTVTDVDLIIVMEAGHVVEQGTHEQLLDLGGVYQALWEKQSGLAVSANGRAIVSSRRLAAIPLFSGLSESRIKAMKESQVFVSEHYEYDQVLFSIGDPGSKFYIIAHGKVEVEWADKSTGELQTQCLADGDYFGEMALLYDVPRNATVRAVADTVVLTLERQAFSLLLEEEPSLRDAIEQEVKARQRSH